MIEQSDLDIIFKSIGEFKSFIKWFMDDFKSSSEENEALCQFIIDYVSERASASLDDVEQAIKKYLEEFG